VKILHVISSADPRFGGPIEGIKQIAQVQRMQGHEIEIASTDDPEDDMVKALPLKVHALGPSRTRYRYAPRFVPWLRAHARNYDAVIVNGLWQYTTYAVRQALHGTSTPYFVFTHGMLDPWFKHTYPLKHVKKWLFWPWADYRVLRDAAAVFFTCEEERQLARLSFWLYRCNEVVVNFGTSMPEGNPENQWAAFYGRYPHLRGQRLFLFLSRIHEKKGCDLLIETFSQIAQADPRLHLVMAGPDQTGWQKALSARAEQLGIGNRITWTGMLSGDLKWGAYRTAEAFVLPSHQENFGIVVAEALACGLPVLISNKVNIWREIEGDVAGIVAPDTLAGTRTLFERWFALTDDARVQMRANALRCFAQRFEIHRAAESLNNALSMTIANRSPLPQGAR
jgi:glycosyltransferase involved in cell wall biosynthesis